MKKGKFIFIIFLAVIFGGCEETSLLEINFERDDYIVVQAELIADSLFQGVTFTKSMGLNEVYSIDQAKLTDIVAYIQIDGIQIIPLHHTTNGLYKPNYDLYIQPGRTYELFGRKGDRQIYSKTKIPTIPEISRTIRLSDYTFAVTIFPNTETVYGAVWEISMGEYSYHADGFYSIVGSENNQLITASTQPLPERYWLGQYYDSTFVRVYAFDKSFLDYFNTKENNQLVRDGYTQGGGPIAWNVFGDKVMGIFIGRTCTDLLKPY